MSLDWSNCAIVALGSNLGDPVATVRAAIDQLRCLSAKPLLVSSLFHSAPVACPPGSPDFINAMVAFEPRRTETPESLLALLQDLEFKFGRRRKGVINEPRPLDLDLIAFGNETRESSSLTLPHPKAAERLFVLQPLAEILPEFILPGCTKTVAELLAEHRA